MTHGNQPARLGRHDGWTAPRWLVGTVLLLAVVATLGGVFGGPALGDHEAIVAQCARDMRLSGDWVVPRFLDTNFVRKPPLPCWLVAAASYLFPNDARTGLPVTTAAARFPSGLAALGTVLLLWRLGSSMFGKRAGLLAGVLASSSLFVLLYAPNATAEMLLTFACTWSYLHFWYAVTAERRGRRLLHLTLFYISLGVAMLAKGPAPVAMVMMPLVVWWYTDRPLRILARGAKGAVRAAWGRFVRGLWPQTAAAFTRLWLVPGLVVFALIFVPWVLAAAARDPQAWNLWDWQYLQRAQGDYEDTRVRGVFYYLPLVAGYLIPWVFMVFEGAAAPWLKRYAAQRRGLLYAGLWAAVGVAVMSLMTFKKPYYVLPAMPGLTLLLAVTAERVFAYRRRFGRRAWVVWGSLAAVAILAIAAAAVWGRRSVNDLAVPLLVTVGAALLMLLVAGAVYIRGRGWLALVLGAATAVVAFHSAWYTCGPTIDRLGKMDKVARLARSLDDANVPPDGRIYWADQRPDARLSFYFDRRSRHMLEAGEIVDRMVDRTQGRLQLEQMAVDRALALLDGPQAVYLITDREHYDQRPRLFEGRGHVLLVVAGEAEEAGKNWLVLTNSLSAGIDGQTADQPLGKPQ